MKKIIQGCLLSLVLAFGFIATPAFAATTLKFVQTPTINLYTSLSSSGTTMRITPYPRDLDGVKLTISDFGSNPTVTVDPKVKNVEEIVGFTGITDNGDNTATLSGLTRDLYSKYPYTTTGTGRPHGSSAIVVFSNNPQMYARFAAWENDGAVTGAWTFASTNRPSYDTTPTFVNGLELIDKAYADALSFAGAPNASTIQKGIVQIATPVQAASSTASGSTAALLVIPASMATSSNDVAGLHAVITQNSGKINWNQIDLGTAFTSTALATFSGGFAATGATTFSATSTAATSTLMVDFDVITTVMASTTFTGFTSPQPAYIATSTGALNLSDANSVFDEQFMGFAVNNATNGQQVLLQRDGIVTGFTGLTKGSDYYVQDAVGTIGTSVGTAEIYVGRAISTTQILMDKSRAMQYLGSQSITVSGDTAINQPLARIAVISANTTNSNGANTQSDITLSLVGKTTSTIAGGAGGGASAYSYQTTYLWTSTSSIRTVQSCSGGGCVGQGTGSATAYYYR